MEDCRHAPIVIRAWIALAVTVAFALAITYSLPCTMAAGSAAHNAAGPAPGYIKALGTLARACSFLVAPRRTFRDARMHGAG